MMNRNTINKACLFLFLLVAGYPLCAQQQKPTEKFVITGLVNKEVSIDKDKLRSYEERNVGNILLINYLGHPQSTLRNARGVRIKDIFADVSLKTDSLEKLSEFYFVFVGSSGHKAVFSWNEIFNNPVGDEIYILTEHDNLKLESLKGRLALLSPLDEATERRYVKNLEKIIVKKAE
ncbi:molybdopterin-binding protein [Emticicia sp. CRIBPO]|uniref:molybdopterin-binding protein n=1 Tax=Emticicia sp. CRIBPO TaxID=2683258 RepID=UPI001412449B|nr:molybdopterin-binding protein [Emticicia sp. CRIBPO]NBA84462.1 molybdopterin-binding protein [Emticicia sp. CRIBPO]